MSCISSILRHISLTPVGVPFTTRDCLKYGSRGAVDKALSRCVKEFIVVRLTWGVFMRMDGKTSMPSPLRVAAIKCRAFAKEIVDHGTDIGFEMKLVSKGNAEPTFFVNGSSSSFRYGSVRIHLKSASKKRMHLKETPLGRIVRSLWQMGADEVTQKLVERVVSLSNTRDIRRSLVLAKAWMPEWLADFFPTLAYPCPLGGPARSAHFIDYFESDMQVQESAASWPLYALAGR
jgi:hypothetical protein